MRSHAQKKGLLCPYTSFSVLPVAPLSNVAACKKQGSLWPAQCVRLERYVSIQRQGSFSPLGRLVVVLSRAQNPGSSNVQALRNHHRPHCNSPGVVAPWQLGHASSTDTAPPGLQRL